MDDETLARENIKSLLKNQSDINNVFEAENASMALEVAELHQPDIIFLDIQMPGQSGIELAEKLPSKSVIIFATAYDQHAITAFDLNAVDYLLKPFNDERFFDALHRARKELLNQGTTDFKQVNELIQQMKAQEDSPYKTRLVIKDPGRIRLIDVEQINFISGAGNYAEIHLFDDKPILHRETLSVLESQLDPKLFIRIHRSSIVRRSSVCELRPNENGDYMVLLKCGTKLALSRRSKAKLDELTSVE